MSLRHWVNEPDRGYGSLRRATRTAIVMPAMFAIGDKVIGNPIMATFAAFGSSALLLLVDFSGSMRDRLRAQAALAGVGAILVCLGTLAGRAVWPSMVAMDLVAFGVLFSGVVGLVLAGATTSLLPAFILAITFAGPVSSIPARLAGWAMASAATLVVIAVLGQPPPVTPLRSSAMVLCRALAERLRADVAYILGGAARPAPRDHRSARRGLVGIRSSPRAPLVDNPTCASTSVAIAAPESITRAGIGCGTTSPPATRGWSVILTCGLPCDLGN